MKCTKPKCETSDKPGTLVKVGKFYVCDKCCSDIFTQDEVDNMVSYEKRDFFIDKPKGSCMEITKLDYKGFYKYQKMESTKYRKIYRIIGKDETVLGQMIFMDYTKSKFIDCKSSILIHIKNVDYVETGTLKSGEVIFLP